MSPSSVVFTAGLLVILVLVLREAVRRPLFLPIFALFLFLFWVFVGFPIGLWASGAGLAVVGAMLVGADVAAWVIYTLLEPDRDETKDI